MHKKFLYYNINSLGVRILLKFKLLLLFLCLSFAFTTPVYAQEFVDMDEDGEVVDEVSDSDETLDDVAPDGEEEEYEDYVEEGEEEVISSTLNERVNYFDIAGISLGMEYDAVRKKLKEHKYKLTNIEYNIPEYFRFNYDDICRQRNILIPENLKACIKGLARKDKMEYVSKVSFKKNDTNEDISVFFTSPITGNKVWKIEYSNDVNKKYGDAKNFQYQREERRRAFWYYVLSKYGEPNVKPNMWVLDTADKYSTKLTAGFGSLVLENQKQYAFDILETTKQARRDFKYTDYSF